MSRPHRKTNFLVGNEPLTEFLRLLRVHDMVKSLVGGVLTLNAVILLLGLLRQQITMTVCPCI
jgi:hypothetical protein